MADTRDQHRANTPSVVERTRAGRGRRAGGRRRISSAHRGLRARRGGAAAGRRQGRRAAACGPRRRHPVGGERRRASSPAATTARCSSTEPRARASRRDRRQAPLDRSRRRRAGRRASPGRPASRPSCMPARASRARSRCLDRRRACLRAEGPAPRDRALQRRDAVVPERQGRARARWSGRARISTSTFSPDGQFLVTAMQEPTLHGWRLADRKDMRMSGYSARVRSLAWTAGGKWLATSGSEQLVLWPFQGKDGPMGKQPRMLAAFEVRVAVVACHPEAGGGGGRLCRRHGAAGARRRRRRGARQETRRAPVTALAGTRPASCCLGHRKRHGQCCHLA